VRAEYLPSPFGWHTMPAPFLGSMQPTSCNRISIGRRAVPGQKSTRNLARTQASPNTAAAADSRTTDCLPLNGTGLPGLVSDVDPQAAAPVTCAILGACLMSYLRQLTSRRFDPQSRLGHRQQAALEEQRSCNNFQLPKSGEKSPIFRDKR